MKRKGRIITASIIAVALAILAASWAYISDYYHAEDEAIEVMAHTTVSIYEEDGVIYFVPDQPIRGMIFYPGAKVQCEAYAPLMEKFAVRGVLCALVRMPGNLAILGKSAADGIPQRFPYVETWYMAGHSLGGAMAASYVAEHTDEYEGLLLLAAYSTSDLSAGGLKILSVYGSDDFVLNMDSYRKYFSNLPDTAEEVVIDGGCHAYFGAYGPQDGDGTPSISRDEQMDKTVDAFMEL